MTDDEIATYCGLAADDLLRPKFIATLMPVKRALYERMKEVEIEAALYVERLGPKPTGVLLDFEKDKRRNKFWR